MTISENRKRYISLHRIFFTLILSTLVTLCTGASAFAAEITPAEADSLAVVTVTPAAGDNTSVDTAPATQEDTLEDGYTVDEQGQVYYNGVAVTSGDTEILDIPEEDIKDTEPDADTDDSEVTDSEAADSDANEEKAEATKEASADKTTAKTSTKGKTTKTAATKVTQPKVEKPSYSEADLRLLSCLIYAEAGNQSYKGMVAVANVVINRAKSDVFWHVDTIKEVIYDRKWSVQFSVTIENSKTGVSPLEKALKIYDTGKYTGANPEAQKKSMQRAIKAAKAALEGTNNIGNYLCFTNKNAAGSIKKRYSDYKIIGDHIFYRTK